MPALRAWRFYVLFPNFKRTCRFNFPKRFPADFHSSSLHVFDIYQAYLLFYLNLIEIYSIFIKNKPLSNS